ncbi:MAG: S41 family peptidase, partial [Pyrinomonadaceae bacterium]
RAGRVFLDPRTRRALLFSVERIPHFGGPLVVLTSEKTASAAEIFAHALQERKRAAILGGETCGCVLGISRARKLADGGTLALSEMDYQTAAGTRLEGVGVTPDERLPLKLSDLVRRRDATLERALEMIRER